MYHDQFYSAAFAIPDAFVTTTRYFLIKAVSEICRSCVYLLTQEIWLHVMRQCLLCKMLH